MILFLIFFLASFFYDQNKAEESGASGLADKMEAPEDVQAPEFSDSEPSAPRADPPQRPNILWRAIRHFIKMHWKALDWIIRICGYIYRFRRSRPQHPTVAMRPLSQREMTAPVHMLMKNVRIDLKRQTKEDAEESASIHSLLEGAPIVEQEKLIVCDSAENGFCRLKRRIYIDIDIPENGEDLSAEAAAMGIRLLYQSLLQTALTPGARGAVERFVFEEFPFISCHGQCAAFHENYGDIMAMSASIFWEAVESIDLVDHSVEIAGKGESFMRYVQALAKKQQILFANRMDEYRVVPLPVAA